MAIEQMTPEEEVRLRLAAGISPSTPTEYMLRHIPLWVKMSILRRNLGAGGTTERVTTYDFTTNTYRKNGGTVSLGDVSEFIRLSSATEGHDGKVVEVANNVPRISGEGLLIEPQRTNMVINTNPIIGQPWAGQKVGIVVVDDSGFFGGRAFLMEESTTGVAGFFHKDLGMLGTVFSLRARAEPSAVMQMRFGNTAIKYVENIGSEYRRETWLVGEEANIGNRNLGVELVSGEAFFWAEPQYELGNAPTSFIPTTDEPATRAPDILNIPLLSTQTITGDWDEGVTHSVADGIATFTGHGYIRNITVEAL